MNARPFREALAAAARAPVLVLVSVLSVGLSLFIIGMFFLAAYNVQSSLDEIGGRVELVAYVRDGASPEQLRLTEAELGRMPEVERVTYISKTEALAMAVQELPEFRDVFTRMEVNPLPGSLELRLHPESRTPETLSRLSAHLLSYPFVEEVHFGQEWLDTLASLQRLAGGATLILGGAFALVAGIIIGTAVSIAVAARREEIEIMRLVGATDWFIGAPFVVEGALAGLFGGLIAVVTTYSVYQAVSLGFVPLIWLPVEWLLAGVLGAAVYGLAASTLAVRRHLRLA